VLFFGLSISVASGCGQANPVTDEGDTGTGEASQYYPLADGASYTYLHTNSDMTQWNEEVQVVAVEFDSKSAFELTDSADPKGEHTKSILRVEDGQVARVHKEVFAGSERAMTVDYDPGFLRFADAWLDEDEGFVEEVGYLRTEFDGNGENPVEEDRLQRYTLDSVSVQVSVAAGEFTNCVEVTRERVIGAERVKTFTFCRGVGKVEEVNHTNGNHEELLTYEVPE
jgi:hypothetical protein